MKENLKYKKENYLKKGRSKTTNRNTAVVI